MRGLEIQVFSGFFIQHSVLVKYGVHIPFITSLPVRLHKSMLIFDYVLPQQNEDVYH